MSHDYLHWSNDDNNIVLYILRTGDDGLQRKAKQHL